MSFRKDSHVKAFDEMAFEQRLGCREKEQALIVSGGKLPKENVPRGENSGYLPCSRGTRRLTWSRRHEGAKQVQACTLSHVQVFATTPWICGSPGLSVHGNFQARILEWVAISSSRGFPSPGAKPASPSSPELSGRFFTTEPPGKPGDRQGQCKP